MAEDKQFTSDIHRIFDNNEEIACADTMGDAEILVDLLNEQEERIKELKIENNQLKRKKERYKLLSEIREENINNRILSLKEFIKNCKDEKVKNTLNDLFYSEVQEYDLAKENRKLKKENKHLRCTIESNSQDDFLGY